MSDQEVYDDFGKTRLLYRCACGNQLVLDQEVGGTCEKCQRVITAESLAIDLSATMAISEDSVHLNRSSSNRLAPEDDFELVGFDPLVGQYFGHFKIINRLGGGGQGHVYRAVDTSLQRFVAVKVLRRGGGTWSSEVASDRDVEFLLQEAVSQARVNHPNVVTIFFVGKERDEPFLAMELVKGMPLSEKMQEGQLPFRKIVDIGLQIAIALQFSQKLDIIHGDIKPSNLLIQDDGTVKLSDFGMARRESKSAASATGGTPNYLAPELIENGETTTQSDTYALGVTFYEMTFGELPVKLTGRTPQEWSESHREQEVAYPEVWPEHLPERWRTILQKMLHPTPQQRYKDYDNLVEDLQAVKAVSNIPAKVVPRLLAGLIDFLSVLLLAGAIQFLLFSVLKLREQTESLLVIFSVSLTNTLPLILYTLAVFFFRQSLGRHLLYLRVVNRYGLRLSARRMLTRSFVRMGFVWLLVSSMVIDVQGYGWSESTRTVFAGAAGLMLAVQVVILIANRRRQTLQDWIYRTNVVLDT